MNEAPMRYSELPAPPELSAWVHSLWVFSVAEGQGEIEHHVPLTGGAVIVVSPGHEAMYMGPRTTPLITAVRGGDRYWGLHFHPSAARSFLRLKAGSLRDEMLPLSVLGPSVDSSFDAEEGLIRLADAALQLAASAVPPDDVVRRAAAAIVHSSGFVRIDVLSAASGLSARHFRRRFVAESGLTPKELVRIRRVRSAAAAAASHLGDRQWADVATDAGYADQPHLAREFRSLLGAGPEAFRRHARRIRHELLD